MLWHGLILCVRLVVIMIMGFMLRGCVWLIDVVMWVHNGARTLPVVLDRINKVIPSGVVGQKIVVDDKSTDNSCSIAVSKGWRVVSNRGHGISEGANTALSYVETEWFASFEQDVLVSPDWFGCVSRLMGKDVAAVSGLRFLPRNNFCYSIDHYLAKSNNGDYGKTLDNTLWNTALLRTTGGFPKVTNAFAETVLHEQFKKFDYRWLVDYNVQSLHLHGGLLDELWHYYFYGANLPELNKRLNWRNDSLLKFVKSPWAALRMTKATCDPRLMVSYPLCRLAMLGGYLRGRA